MGTERLINMVRFIRPVGFMRQMDIGEYIKKKKKDLNKSSENIKNSNVFQFNYIPKKPLMRQEAKPIIDALLRYNQTGIANHILILGSRGCGKSLLAKYLMQLFDQETNLQFIYVNCRQYNTSYRILSSLLGVPPRGNSLSELWQQFTTAFKGKTVLILDEIDLIKDKDQRTDILYLLSRSDRNYMALMLSNDPKFTHSLDESIRSTLQPELIHFSNYNATEIEKILTDRAAHGLRNIPIKEIRNIAARTRKFTNSDVRVAIKTLYLSALEPRVNIEEHFERARRDIVIDVVKDLNDKNLQILQAILKCSDEFVKSIYEKYRSISIQNQDEPYSYAFFYTSLSYLQSLGLIVLISTKVNQAYTNRIQLTFDSEVLQGVWQFRFGQ
jgi:cell division control protein 6